MKQIFGERLHFDWRVVLVTVLSTLLLLVDSYHRLTPVKYYDRLLLYLVIPLLTILLVFREKPAAYGFGVGDWQAGIVITVGAILLMAPILWFVARQDGTHQFSRTLDEHNRAVAQYRRGATEHRR